MAPLANHISVFLRQRPPIERRASERASETYVLALRLFVEFAAEHDIGCIYLRSFCRAMALGTHCNTGVRIHRNLAIVRRTKKSPS
jgi:hypothetical protein